MAEGAFTLRRRGRARAWVGTAVGALVTRKGAKRRIAVSLALLGPMFIALGMMPASANNGTVVATQNCQTWHVSVSLNHNVTPDRSVDVVTTIPGTTGISGGHYNTSDGEIWSAGGPAPSSGTVTLNIYYANGQLEFTESKTLPPPEGCVTTTTSAPTTSTTVAPTTTTVAPTTTTTFATEGTTATTGPSTSTSTVSTVPGSTTIVTEGASVTSATTAPSGVTTAGGTSAVGAANALPRTGSGGPGPAIGLASLLAGAVMLLASRRHRRLS